MNDLVIAAIRTIVPAIVGAVIAFLVSVNVLDPGTSEAASIGLTSFLTAVFTGGYYVAVRLLAEKFPGAGILLGVNKAPSYEA